MHKETAVTVENISQELVPYPRINLSNAEDIRREIARVYRDTKLGLIKTSDATKLTFILVQLIKAYETSVIEDRVYQLELAHKRKP